MTWMRWLVLLVCVCACQSKQPARPSAELPIAAAPPSSAHSAGGGEPQADVSDLAGTWRVKFDFHHESACSQSYATSSRSGQYLLVIDRDGKFSSQIDIHHMESFGPSPGRYLAGDRGFDRRSDTSRTRIQGTARLERGTLKLSMLPNTLKCTGIQGDGSDGEPIKCEASSPTSMECNQGDIESQAAAIGSQDAGTERVFVLRCPWPSDRIAYGFTGLEKAPLAKKPGLDVSGHEMAHAGSSTQIRRAEEDHGKVAR